MEHNVILQVFDDKGNMHTWKYFTIKDYLIAENHVYADRLWKFHKGMVNGVELKYSDDCKVNSMRDVTDFKSFCRRKIERKEIKMEVPKNIIQKFLLEENKDKRNRIQEAISKGAKNVNNEYNNGGGGLCEYRPGRISGYGFFKAKGVEISWLNEKADVCEGVVTRTQIFNEISELIRQGKYSTIKTDIKPTISILTDSKQLLGQMDLFDFIGA